MEPNKQNSFFERSKNPYYISTPAFQQTSAGVRALHYLCHTLNELGQEAYVTSSYANCSPHLRTPQLTNEIIEQHKISRVIPIAVYPEIIQGNPLNLQVIARWLLNKPGHLGGNTTFDPSDLIFRYHINLDGIPRLDIPLVDRRIFNNTNENRQGFCYYAGKYLRFNNKISPDVINNPNGTSLTPDIPRSHNEIADILRSSEAFYCYEPSNMVYEALACGCPVAFVETPYIKEFLAILDKIPIKFPMVPESEIGKNSIPIVNQATIDSLFLKIEKDAELDLKNFIQLTQDAAHKKISTKKSTTEILQTPTNDRSISFVICSIDDTKYSLISRHLAAICTVHHEIIRISDAKSLSEGYTRGISQARFETIVLCHDDIDLLCDTALAEILHNALREFDVVGVAGPRVLKSAFWLNGGPSNTAGMVIHGPVGNPDAPFAINFYDTSEDRTIPVQAVDGVFIAAKKQVFASVQFDAELFDGFHLYDIDFSFRCHLQGFRVGITKDLGLVHASVGKFSADWLRYEERFHRKYPGLARARLTPSQAPAVLHVSSLAEAALTFRAPESLLLPNLKFSQLALANHYFTQNNSRISPQLREQAYTKFLASHQITPPEAEMFELRLKEWEVKFGHPQRVLITIYTLEHFISGLTATIMSLAKQYYDHIDVVVVSPAEVPEELRYGTSIRWFQSADAPHAAINQAVSESDADWVLSLNAGDQITPHTLLLLLEAVHTHPERKLIFADDDRRDEQSGSFDQPFFKPDFDLDYLRSLPWIGDCYLVSRSLLDELGGYAPEFAGMAEYDLQLRTYDRYGPTAFGHVSDVLFHLVRERGTAQQPTTELVELGREALARHLENHGLPVKSLENGSLPGTYRVSYPLPTQAAVSIIMISRGRADTLRRSLSALYAQTSGLQNGLQVEIIVIDAASNDSDTLACLQEFDGADNDRVRIFPADRVDMGYSRLLNLGVAQAQGDFLLFLAADCVPLSTNWLSSLLAHGHRPGIGCVGGRLIDKQGQIVSAGRVLGLLGDAASPWQGIKFDQPGHFGRLQCPQQRQALSMECLLVKRSTFVEAGGFDEGFRYLFADVDLCLRLRNQGFTHIWTPDATLLHEALDLLVLSDVPDDEKQGVYEVDRDRLYDFWLDTLANDPSYNCNLSLFNTDEIIEPRSELTKQKLTWRPLPRMLAIPMDNAGCGNYRVVEPFNAGIRTNRIDGWCRFGTFQALDVARMAPDILYLQRHVLDEHQAALANYRRHFPKTRIIFELDDLMWAVPEKSIYRHQLPNDLKERITHSLSLCDRLIVTTEPLAEMLRGLVTDIRVIPNSIDTTIWGNLTPRRRKNPKPRVGWAGGSSHTGDLEILIPVIEALKDEVDWIFFGMHPSGTQHLIKEFHGGVTFAEYAPKLAALDLDLALAPLEENLFNECKSNLRLLEYGILGYPVIATNLSPYRCGLPVTLIDNTPESWISAIRAAVADRVALAGKGDALRAEILSNWTLDKHQDAWLAAWLDNLAPLSR